MKAVKIVFVNLQMIMLKESDIMSGPKTSRYTLTAEQRRILAEQQRIERRKAVAIEKIKSKSKRIAEIESIFSDDKLIAAELFKRTGSDSGFSEKINELQQLNDSCKNMINETDNSDLQSLERTVDSTSVMLSEAKKIVEDIKIIAIKNETLLNSNLNSDIDKGFSSYFADITVVSKLDEDKNALITELKLLVNNDILPVEYKIKAKELIEKLSDISDTEHLKNFNALSIRPLIKSCNSYMAEYEQYHTEFEELYSEYNALCELYYYVPQEYVCSADAVAKLKDEIDRIKSIAAEDEEQAYISNCIDEVMEEMGYSVLGSREVTKKNGRHFRNELYTYSEGTAVNVTYSSDGKIAMELGGIDTTDRLPDTDETKVLFDAMEDFCTDFKEIEKRLLQKGVVLADRISLLPPTADYAQIINTSDYHMDKEVDRIQVRKHQHTVQKNKTMKVE